MEKSKIVYLLGYYPKIIEDSFSSWSCDWLMCPEDEENWIWFEGEYTEEQVRNILLTNTNS